MSRLVIIQLHNCHSICDHFYQIVMNVKKILVIILQLVQTLWVHSPAPVMLDFLAMDLSVKVLDLGVIQVEIHVRNRMH